MTDGREVHADRLVLLNTRWKTIEWPILYSREDLTHNLDRVKKTNVTNSRVYNSKLGQLVHYNWPMVHSCARVMNMLSQTTCPPFFLPTIIYATPFPIPRRKTIAHPIQCFPHCYLNTDLVTKGCSGVPARTFEKMKSFSFITFTTTRHAHLCKFSQSSVFYHYKS